MEVSSCVIGVFLGTILMVALGPTSGSDLFDVDVRQLAEAWERERISPADPYSLKHTELKRNLEAVAKEFPDIIRLERAGSSVEGREIFLVSVGTGQQKILLWSQMHGDEPTATNSLLDLFQFLGRHKQDAWVAGILGQYTLLCIPMLNPDGAEVNQRRNAQGIDINRDARMLQSPEGRLLKELRDRYQPFLGFNLHNQNSLTTVGDTGEVATIALLAVAADMPAPVVPDSLAGGVSSDTALLTRRITAVLYEALAPFAYGHISRYDETYNPRAFGDNMTVWGTPIVLMESGGHPAGQPPQFGVKLNFVGLLAALNSLATGRIRNANPAVYDALKMNSDNPIFDLMLRNAWIFSGTGVPLFRGDIAIRKDLRAGAGGDAIVADIGDLGVFKAHRTMDCSGALVTPGLIAWDPDQSPLTPTRNETEYLRKGIVTLLQTLTAADLDRSAPESWQATPSPLNRGFLISGWPSTKSRQPELRLAEWMAAGARGWILERTQNPAGLPAAQKMPGWFGIELMTPDEASKYRMTSALQGDPAKVLTQWTSEAARRFRVPKRGTISLGSIADLVIWKTSSDSPPADLRDCKPSHIVVNGQIWDFSSSESDLRGRFIGR